MTTTQTPQAFLKIGDALVLTQSYNSGASPPVGINLTGYTITVLIKDGTDTTTLATLTIGSGVTLGDQTASPGSFVGLYTATSGWAGNILVQFRFVDLAGLVGTSDPITIAMQATL